MTVRLKEDILKMRFEEIYGQFKGKQLSCSEAAMILGMSERTFLRKRDRFEDPEFKGQWDLRLGKKPRHTAEDIEILLLTKMYNERFTDFTAKHFYQHYKRASEPQKKRSYNWVRMTLQKAGLLTKSSRGGPHRLRRERALMEGMLLHQDASTHEWVPGKKWDLVATLDDATSKITSLFFVDEEGTYSSLRGLYETVSVYGLFCTLYTDRGSHYAYTPEAGGKVDKTKPTQVGKALKRMGIVHKHAYSPQARGRSERLFGTLQGRLPKELALRGIQTMEEANKYLREEYIKEHNVEFGIKACSEKRAYHPWLDKDRLFEELSERYEREVQNDNTVRFEGKILQIAKNETRPHYVRCGVEVRKYLDQSLGVFYGPQCIGRYSRTGENLEIGRHELSTGSTAHPSFAA